MLTLAQHGPLRELLRLGAHSDDIETGCGGTVLRLVSENPGLRVSWVVLSAEGARTAEAHARSEAFLARTWGSAVRVESFPERLFPSEQGTMQRWFDTLHRRVDPDLILTHRREDAHQDPSQRRRAHLEHVPGPPDLRVRDPEVGGPPGPAEGLRSAGREVAERKAALLLAGFPSHHGRYWFTAEDFLAILRLQGVEGSSGRRVRRGVPRPQAHVQTRSRRTDMTVDLSVIMPVRNGAELLARQLDQLSPQEFQGTWEVVLLDNGSTDDTRGVAESYAHRLPCLVLVDSSDRPGRSGAVNAGAEVTRSENLATCDHDDILGLTSVAAMASALTSSRLVAGIVAPPAEPLAAEGLEVTAFPDQPPVHGALLPYALGCNMGFRRELHRALGGFDSTMDGAEDIDCSWRAQLGGDVVVFEPEARVLKGRRATAGGSFRQHRFYGRVDVLLAERYRPHGYPVARSPRAPVTPAARGEWAGLAGRVVGVLAQASPSRLTRSSPRQ